MSGRWKLPKDATLFPQKSRHWYPPQRTWVWHGLADDRLKYKILTYSYRLCPHCGIKFARGRWISRPGCSGLWQPDETTAEASHTWRRLSTGWARLVPRQPRRNPGGLRRTKRCCSRNYAKSPIGSSLNRARRKSGPISVCFSWGVHVWRRATAIEIGESHFSHLYKALFNQENTVSLWALQREPRSSVELAKMHREFQVWGQAVWVPHK